MNLNEFRILAMKKGWRIHELSPLGYEGGMAFDRGDAISIINYARNDILPVVGIDVYIQSNETIRQSETYDCFCCDIIENESYSHYVVRCFESSLKFLEKYTDSMYLFDVVIGDMETVMSYLDQFDQRTS